MSKTQAKQRANKEQAHAKLKTTNKVFSQHQTNKQTNKNKQTTQNNKQSIKLSAINSQQDT